MQFANTKKENINISKPPLKIITLSGTESVTRNMTLYECGEDIIAVDCGVGFPDSEMYGVDVVIPDMTYLYENAHRVRGLFITHGHEDHIGSIPYLLRELNIPIYANKLVQGFIKEKLSDKFFKDIFEKTKFVLISPESEEVTVGCFKISAFRVNHSVPSSMGFAIRTPQGTVIHMADYKIDWTPVLDKPIDLATIAKLGDSGVLCLLSDCLGATTEGFSKTERSMDNTFSDLFEQGEGRQVLITTISSNISRMYQIIDSALKHQRKVVLAGRSIHQSVSVAKQLGYLPFDEVVYVNESGSSDFAQKDLVYIIAGCYGQQGSALDRLSRSENENISLEDNAMVVFSADPNPPGVAEAVERMMDNLTLAGAEVIYSKIQENLHVSGHGTRGDLITVAAIAKPKYFIPIGGTVTKMRAYRNLVGTLGVQKGQVFELLEGESVVFENGRAKKGGKLELKPVFVDGSGVGDIGPVVMKDREQLSSDGVFVVVIPTNKEGNKVVGSVDVITRGFVYVKESKALMGKSRDVVNKVLDKYKDNIDDWGNVKRKIERETARFLFKETGRKPLIIVHSITI
ncbi:MAG TPA: ribonuclease J [Patescibacteria group bacterium]|nr:ribonuclease J [Patescibacteria group bacterium]